MDSGILNETDSEQGAYPMAEASGYYRYEVVREELELPDTCRYIAYGISVCRNDTEIEFISDITTDRVALEELVDRCNRDGLDALHIYDIIDDFLAR